MEDYVKVSDSYLRLFFDENHDYRVDDHPLSFVEILQAMAQEITQYRNGSIVKWLEDEVVVTNRALYHSESERKRLQKMVTDLQAELDLFYAIGLDKQNP